MSSPPPKNPNKTIVLLKRSAYELAILHGNSALEKQIQAQGPSTSRLLVAHSEHTLGIEKLKKILLEFFTGVEYFYRENLEDPFFLARFREAENIITYGGDGTFLWGAKHALPHQNLISINSSPSTSSGFYSCGSIVDFQEFLRYGGFAKEFNGAKAKEMLEYISTIKYTVSDPSNQKIVNEGVAINDLLVSGVHPASSAKYWLMESGFSRTQISSGLWICSPLGSHGAVRSAGGIRQLADDARLQWKVRELYLKPNVSPFDSKNNFQGFVPQNETLEVVSNMRQGLISPDGDTNSIPFGFEQRLICRLNYRALRLFSRKSK